MPLDREHVTAASRIMLPTYVAFFAGLGANYIGSGPTASANPTLRFADDLMPLPVWGALFLICACVMGVSLVIHQRLLYRFALRMCAGAMLVWAFVILFASLSGDATPGAVVWPAFVAAACMATDKSLATRER